MDINVSNLDLGYSQCEDLNRLGTETGGDLVSRLGQNITNLKAHWIGSDATANINKLIVVHKALEAIVSDAITVSAAAGNRIVAIQEVRNMNGGGGNVGAALNKNVPTDLAIADCSDTSEYYVDPAAAADYTDLQGILSDYTNFKDSFSSLKDELLQNWTAGSDRERAVAAFNEFTQNADTYNKYLTEAKEILGIAVSNIQQLS